METISPDFKFLDQVEAIGPFNAGACFQCRKCTNGCPVTFAMDLQPDEVVRLVTLGRRERVLGCNTIWVCAACETCSTRCPNEVEIAGLMDCLKEMAVNEGLPSPQPQVLVLHETFLDNMRTWGRVFEATLLPVFMLKSGEFKRKWKDGTWLDELKLGLTLFLKGRFALLPGMIRGKFDVRRIIGQGKRKK